MPNDNRTDVQKMKDFALYRELKRTLEGKVLRRQANASDSDFSGGGWYEERNLALFLFKDGTFRWEKDTHSVVRGGGMSLPSRRQETHVGNWQLDVRNGLAELVLIEEGREFGRWATSDAGPGVQVIGTESWNRYLIRT